MEEEEDYQKFLEELAHAELDEKFVHHPEWLPAKESLIQQKTKELAHQIEEKNKRVLEDLQLAGKVLIQWIATLPPEHRDRISSEIAQINKNIESGSFSPEKLMEGEFSLQNLLNVSDTFLKDVYKEAVRLQEQKFFIESMSLFKFLILLNPFFSDFWIGGGFSALNMHEMEEAKTFFETAVSIDPQNPRCYYFAAVCAKVNNDQHSALNYWEHGHNLSHPEWEEPFNQLKESINRG